VGGEAAIFPAPPPLLGQALVLRVEGRNPLAGAIDEIFEIVW
jgi:hypothetical protein